MTKEEILAKNCHIEKHPHADGKVVYSTIESVMAAMEVYKRESNAENCPKNWGEPEWESLPVGIQKVFGCLDYLNNEEELSDYGHERIASAIHALECEEYATQEKQGWVKCSEMLPEFGLKVLVLGEQKGMNPQMGGAYPCISVRQNLKGTMLEGRTERLQDENQFQMMSYVTHWMPLPEPPKN